MIDSWVQIKFAVEGQRYVARLNPDEMEADQSFICSIQLGVIAQSEKLTAQFQALATDVVKAFLEQRGVTPIAEFDTPLAKLDD